MYVKKIVTNWEKNSNQKNPRAQQKYLYFPATLFLYALGYCGLNQLQNGDQTRVKCCFLPVTWMQCCQSWPSCHLKAQQYHFRWVQSKIKMFRYCTWQNSDQLRRKQQPKKPKSAAEKFRFSSYFIAIRTLLSRFEPVAKWRSDSGTISFSSGKLDALLLMLAFLSFKSPAVLFSLGSV